MKDYNPSNVGLTTEEIFRNMDSKDLDLHLMNAEAKLKEQEEIITAVKKILGERKNA